MRDLNKLIEAKKNVGPLGAIDFLIGIAKKRENCLIPEIDLGNEIYDSSISHVNYLENTSILVSVIMTAYNAEKTIQKSIDSVLCQSLSKLELIVVDDNSTDKTIEIVKCIASQDRRVKLLQCWQNRGTYWAKNLGILHATGKYIALHDSDDISLENRLERQIDFLKKYKSKFCYTNWLRTDSMGNPVSNRGMFERLGYPTLMLTREVIETVGFFDAVRIAADDEYHSRLKLKIGTNPPFHLDELQYIAPLSDNSLTAKNPVHINLQNLNDHLSFLSDDRKRYVYAYRDWHSQAGDLVMPFPMRKRKIAAPETIIKDNELLSDPVIASLASMPSRIDSLKRVVASILPQVDILRVHLNNYKFTPDFLNNKKILITSSNDYGDIRDNGKFLNIENYPNAYHITIDDDLEYPSGYVAYLVAKVMQYGNRAIVGLHGTTFTKKFKRYHDSESRKTKTFHLENKSDFEVHLLGTGTVAYHTSSVDFSIKDIQSTGMVDIWLALYANKMKLPMICVQRKANWLVEQEQAQLNSLYKEYIESDQLQSKIILESGIIEKKFIFQ